jgi:hypothetical protein
MELKTNNPRSSPTASGALTGCLRNARSLPWEGEPLTTTEATNSLDVGRPGTYEFLETLVEHDRLKMEKPVSDVNVVVRSHDG